jgi:hypothetical protein
LYGQSINAAHLELLLGIDRQFGIDTTRTGHGFIRSFQDFGIVKSVGVAG